MALSAQQRYLVLIRLYLNDYTDANRLLRAEESSDNKILLAITHVLSDWNASDPVRRTYTCDNFPSTHLLIDGAVIQLLRMAGIYNSRNKLNYSAGGLSVQLHDKGQEYMAWLNSMKQEYEMAKVSLLRRINLASALGSGACGINSDYIMASLSPVFGAFV
jgi:hypothetical protein